jgi:acetyl esterase/lipase
MDLPSEYTTLARITSMTNLTKENISAPVRLWEGPAPHANGTGPEHVPTLTVFLPEDAGTPSAAMVVCPGGGYGDLADHEGRGYDRWLAGNGVAGLVLQYRLGSAGYRHPVMLIDAARALRLTRFRAKDWRIDPARIGIIGSSAGGHLAASLLTHFDHGNPAAGDPVDRMSSRPALGVLCYPVITMGAATHAGSRKNLLGDDPSPARLKELSNEEHVSGDTSPCFVWHTMEDTVVPMENSTGFASALRGKGIPFELHVYQTGRHGIGLGGKIPGPYHRWTSDCVAWLREQDFIR